MFRDKLKRNLGLISENSTQLESRSKKFVKMEKYFAYNLKFLSLFGINLEAIEVRKQKYETAFKIFTASILVATTLQSFLYVITGESFDVSTGIALTVGLYDIQGCGKFLTVLWNIGKLRKVKKELDGLTSKLTREQLSENTAEFETYRKVTTWILAFYSNCIFLCNLLPLVVLIHSYFVEGVANKILPCAFWYPFDRFEYFVLTYTYEAIGGHILTVVSPAMDGLMLLMVGQFVVLFKCLGENFASIINNSEASQPTETSKKLFQAIQLHNDILDLSAEFIEIYEIPLLINVLAQTGTICFISIVATVSNLLTFYEPKLEEKTSG